MELFEALYGRRTIKDFRTDAVPADLLERALNTGLWAQNHKLTQPWRFTVLGPRTHRALAEGFADEQAASAGADADAVRASALEKLLAKPCIVAVSQYLEGSPAQRREDYAAISCAVQNIQLAAWAEGIGMQWSSGKIIGSPRTYETLGIDAAREEIIGLLFFGYPAKVPAAAERHPLSAVSRQLP